MYIRALGNTVQLCRWQVNYFMENPDQTTTPMAEYVPTEEEADALVKMHSGTKTRLETAADEWIDGIIVDSLDQGHEIAAMGEQGYKRWMIQQKMQTPESMQQLLHDAQAALVEIYEAVMAMQEENKNI